MQPVAVATRIALPAAPALVVGTAKAAWLSPDGEIETLSLHEAAARARTVPPFLCHAKAVARRLNVPVFPAYDVLELCTFTRPAMFCLPTPRGLVRALDLPAAGAGIDAEAAALIAAAEALLQELSLARDPEARAIAQAMERGGWAWGEAVLRALGPAPAGQDTPAGMTVWRKLGEWAEYAPEPPAGAVAVEAGRGAAAPCRIARRRCRAAAAAIGLRRCGQRRLPSARGAGRAEFRSGGGRHRGRQDAGLYRARQPVGRKEPRPGMDFDLHQESAAPDLVGVGPALSRPDGAKRAASSSARAARIISVS